MNSQKITFIGAGNMAYSLIGGLLKQGFDGNNIIATDPYAPSREKLETLGISTTEDNLAAIAEADAVVLAVKPQVMQSVLEPLHNALTAQKPLLISIAAGIDIRSIQAWGGDLPIVRCMPNTPALLQLGASGLYANEQVNNTQKTLAGAILNAVGMSVWLDNETAIDAVTAVSGSGPAYFFLMMEAMQAAGIKQGLDAETAKALTLQTALGAASMAMQSDVDAAELRRRVTSPGGTTEQALKTFNEGGFSELVELAMKNCADHSQVLAKNLGA